jgi:hypothetical protein
MFEQFEYLGVMDVFFLISEKMVADVVEGIGG